MVYFSLTRELLLNSLCMANIIRLFSRGISYNVIINYLIIRDKNLCILFFYLRKDSGRICIFWEVTSMYNVYSAGYMCECAITLPVLVCVKRTQKYIMRQQLITIRIVSPLRNVRGSHTRYRGAFTLYVC